MGHSTLLYRIFESQWQRRNFSSHPYPSIYLGRVINKVHLALFSEKKLWVSSHREQHKTVRPVTNGASVHNSHDQAGGCATHAYLNQAGGPRNHLQHRRPSVTRVHEKSQWGLQAVGFHLTAKTTKERLTRLPENASKYLTRGTTATLQSCP